MIRHEKNGRRIATQIEEREVICSTVVGEVRLVSVVRLSSVQN